MTIWKKPYRTLGPTLHGTALADERNLRELLEEALKADLPSAGEPVRNPLDRYAQLPEVTRKWLEELREEDLSDLDLILLAFRRTTTLAWFVKWIIITITGSGMATVLFGEKISQALKYLAS